MLRIGVLLPGDTGRLGEFLADARALETAGAHALWLEEGTQDPWMLAAALATVTSRARLGVSVASGIPVEVLVPRLRTLDDLSRGRAELRGSAASAGPARQLIRAVDRCRFFSEAEEDGWASLSGMIDGIVLSGREPDEDRVRIEQARARIGPAPRSAAIECWVQVKLPQSHADWRGMLSAYDAAGADGLLVSLDPRLVDLLRRADEEDDRSDLTLALG